MIRPAILTVALAAAFIGFAVPAIAGDDNDPHMKMFTWDGRYFDKDGTHPRYNRRQDGKKAKDSMGRDGSMMKGQGKGKAPKGGREPGRSPGRS
jgi:hypothetical protein